LEAQVVQLLVEPVVISPSLLAAAEMGLRLRLVLLAESS